MLGAAGRNDLGRGIFQAEIRLHSAADGFAQLNDAGRRRVPGFIIMDRGNTRILNILWCVKIRFASAESHDVDSVGFHLLEHVVDG
ncbi:hypothetical protein SDC9_75089 [bioreactor metagenome]|uniref:Uncharacterized protein n=1 Tax=bioreactor metagenome TaxID=1076179 RepID=A0A644YQ03_9ZZZZ